MQHPDTIALILIITFIIILWFIGGVMNALADEIVAVCPDTGCVFLEVEPYYSTYPEGSKARMTAYCNQTSDLPEELNYMKCL